MLKKKVASAYRLFRRGGVKAVYDHSWLKLQIKAKGRNHQARLNGCTFSLDGVHSISRIDLITNKYELAERRAVARYLRRELAVVELGASMGVVACVTNRLLNNPEAHVVVEANPLVIPQLELNRALNGCQFEIVNRAIAYGMDSVTFRPSSSFCGSSITEPGDRPPVTVATAQLASLVRERGFGRFNLICDIEGSEYDLVCHDSEVLKKADTIILETHARFIGDEKCALLMNKLKGLGLMVVKEIGFVVVLRQ